jgi:hypothetical protein
MVTLTETCRASVSGVLKSIVLLALAFEIFWTFANFKELNSAEFLQNIAERLVSGEQFEAEVLENIPAASDTGSIGSCHPTMARTAAIVQLRLVEMSIYKADQASLEKRLDNLEKLSRRALFCSPTDSYLWLILYWVDVRRHGLGDKQIEYLEMSYRLGKNEGWIAERRNGLALAVFEQLPLLLQENVIFEFSRLVDAGFIYSAAKNLMGPGWPLQDKLLSSLTNVKLDMLLRFAKALRKEGMYVDIPGLPPMERRPWN